MQDFFQSASLTFTIVSRAIAWFMTVEILLLE